MRTNINKETSTDRYTRDTNAHRHKHKHNTHAHRHKWTSKHKLIHTHEHTRTHKHMRTCAHTIHVHKTRQPTPNLYAHTHSSAMFTPTRTLVITHLEMKETPTPDCTWYSSQCPHVATANCSRLNSDATILCMQTFSRSDRSTTSTKHSCSYSYCYCSYF